MSAWENIDTDTGLRRMPVPGGWLYAVGVNLPPTFVPAQLGRDIGGLAFHRKVKVCPSGHFVLESLGIVALPNNTIYFDGGFWYAMPLWAITPTPGRAHDFKEDAVQEARIAYWNTHSVEVDCLGMVNEQGSEVPPQYTLVCVIKGQVCHVPPSCAQVVS